MKYMRCIFMFCTLVLLWSCQPKTVPAPVIPQPLPPALSEITIVTRPSGGLVTVEENGRKIEDGGTVQLSPGRYTLKAEKEGYRDGTVVIDVDGTAHQQVDVYLGEGYAPVSLSASPEGVMVAIDGISRGSSPLKTELAEGAHTVEFSKKGFFNVTETITVVPGKPVRLEKTLQEIPTRGLLKVKTEPDGGDIYFNEKNVGTGTATLGELPFGRYSVSGQKLLDPFTRLVGSKSFENTKPELLTVTLSLDSRERLFEGNWMPEAEALKKENDRYLSQRVTHPVMLDVTLTKNQLQSLASDKMLSKTLYTLLRPGDRILFKHGKDQWLAWKRTLTKTVPEKFTYAVDSFVKQQQADTPWTEDTVSKTIKLKPGKNVLTEIAFALHQSRADFPLLYFDFNQLEQKGETIHRSSGDGKLTLVASGGEGVTIPGGEWEDNLSENLLFTEMDASDGPFALTWQKAPERLLIVSDRKERLFVEADEMRIQPLEKKVISLVSGSKVSKVIRLSSGPDYNGWVRDRMIADGPLADMLDLSRGEVGPHEKPGVYQRIWLVNFGQTQRQVSVRYNVGGDTKDFTSDKFLRRNASETGKEQEKR